MLLIFPLAFIFVFFSNSVLGKDSAIATYVEEINNLIPDGKKKLNTVKFLKDSDNWGILEKAASTDPEGTFAVSYKILGLLLKDGIGLFDQCPYTCKDPIAKQFDEIMEAFGGTVKHVMLSETGKATVLNKETVDQFKPEDFVKLLAKALTAFDLVYKTPSAKEEFTNPRPIEVVVPKLSLALKEFTSTKWEKEFYEKLTKAADDKPYETDKPDKAGKQDKLENPDKQNLFGYGVAIFVIILLIGGPAIFLVLRRKRQASSSA
jgi:hypothetical protein